MLSPTPKSLVAQLTYWARNQRSTALFKALRQYCQGEVLDVGGRDFFMTVVPLNLKFNHWTCLERSIEVPVMQHAQLTSVVGDGCQMDFPKDRFDTVLNIQVLEHVMEPLKMVSEISRVLKPSGYAIFLIPQTSVLHELPDHYYNFTCFWIKKAFSKYGLEIIELKPLGGLWSSMASHLVYFFLKIFRCHGYTTSEFTRNFWYYLLLPVMILYAIVSIPICLVLSFGDLIEEPNNYLVVARKMNP